ncbi:BON domain-containing protein [uncultured Tateyamaria sp.]|uniref:BON domain-containing protein n=1 Tax=uncultured Tateyamaria sp. TaxID=455651 RepID=UPI002639C13C|nr:BON domain-containing protein [uncultured Tateyamaria sp.]
MGKWPFVKGRGKVLTNDGVDLTADILRDELRRLDLDARHLSIQVQDDVVFLSGGVPAQDDKERIILTVGNVHGVAAVIEDIPSAGEPSFYTIVPGDTLKSVAATRLGCADRCQDILAANRPMLASADMIYRGQVLRLPHV